MSDHDVDLLSMAVVGFTVGLVVGILLSGG